MLAQILLIPGISTGYPNILLFPRDFGNAAWTKAQVSASGLQLLETAVTSTHGISQNVASSNGATKHRIRLVVQGINRNWVWLSSTNTAGSSAVGAYFDISGAGAIGTTHAIAGSSVARSITKNGSWYEIVQDFTHTNTSGVGVQLFITPANGTISYAGNTSNGILVKSVNLWVP